MKKSKVYGFKVGDVVRNRFRRGDGTMHDEMGIITRLWGKVPYAADVIEKTGGIRACLSELTVIHRTQSEKR